MRPALAFRAALSAAVLAAAGAAQAHDLTATKLVNGQPSFVVDTYPTTLHFTFEVADAHPTLPSTLLSADDPLLDMQGFSFTPAPPQTINPGDKITYSLDVVINSEEDCRAFGLADDDPTTPGEGPDYSFTNTFVIGWDTGAAQSSTQVTCKAGPRFTCDRTLYVTLQPPSGGTTLNIFDPVAATLTPINSTPLRTNALGFDPVTGYMYALAQVAGRVPRLVRFDGGGNSVDFGPVTGLPATVGSGWTSGAFLQDGTFIVYGNSGRAATIDVGSVAATRLINTNRFSGIADWAVGPLDGKIYAYNGTTRRLETFDLATGVFTGVGAMCPVNAMGNVVGITAGSAFFEPDGTFYLYGQDVNNPGPQNTLYRVDVATCTFTKIVAGPGVNNSDGASCAFLEAPVTLRDAGFYAVHEDALAACLGPGPLVAGEVRLGSIDEALGLLWSDPAFTPAGATRSAAAADAVRAARRQLVSDCDARLAPDFSAAPATPTHALARARAHLR